MKSVTQFVRTAAASVAGRHGRRAVMTGAAATGGSGAKGGYGAGAAIAAVAATAAALGLSGDCKLPEAVNPRDVGQLKLFTGSANVPLATDIAQNLGQDLGSIRVSRFADGEINIRILENVRGADVYLLQPTCTPVNDNLMQLILMVSTMRRASAARITAVIPYYGYARQDRKMTSRVPISAADVARLLEAVGVDRVVAVDLHCGQIQGFFGPRVPVDNLAAGMVGVEYFAKTLKDLKDPVVVSPDAGGVYRAKRFRERLNHARPGTDAGLAMIIKQRKKAGQVDRMDLVGEVAGSDVIIVDDMIDTAGTLCHAAKHLKDAGARRVYCFATHGVFSGPAITRINDSVLEKVVVCNTIPSKSAAKVSPKIHYQTVGPLLAEAIMRIHTDLSVSALFDAKDAAAKKQDA